MIRPRYFAMEVKKAFHRYDAFRDSRGGEEGHGTAEAYLEEESVPRGCLLVPWWQAAQRGCGTTHRACLESSVREEHQRPTHQAHDAAHRAVVVDSMPEGVQERKELACPHHFICFQCSCFLQLLIDAVLLHCMML